MRTLRLISTFAAAVFLIAWSTVTSLIFQEQVQQPKPAPKIESPLGISQEILDLRTKLGGGVSKVFANSELSQAADDAFTHELNRLEKNETNPAAMIRFRQFARSMESIASEMEDDGLYELADRLRKEAHDLRLRARSLSR